MNEHRVREKLVLKKHIRKKLSKLFMTVIAFLMVMISIKKNPSLKEKIEKKVYEDSISFKTSRTLYEKYFDNLFIKEETKPVSSTKLEYTNEKKYQDGVILTVSSNYPVPSLESGVVIFLKKDKIIVEQVDGIKTTYEKLKNINYKLYDYIEKGEIVGESSNELYLSFEKEGEFLDYKKYI